MKTKVISVRIPWDLYEEILIEMQQRDVNISEWVVYQFALVKNFDKKIEAIKNVIENCDNPDCSIIRRIKNILRDSPLSF